MPRMVATTKPRLKTIESKPLQIVDRFRENCRRLMTEQNLSQVELRNRICKITGKEITRPAVMQKINSDHAPSMEWIEIFARAFDEPTEDMIL